MTHLRSVPPAYHRQFFFESHVDVTPIVQPHERIREPSVRPSITNLNIVAFVT